MRKKKHDTRISKYLKSKIKRIDEQNKTVQYINTQTRCYCTMELEKAEEKST